MRSPRTSESQSPRSTSSGPGDQQAAESDGLPLNNGRDRKKKPRRLAPRPRRPRKQRKLPRNPARRRAPVRRLQRNHPRKPPGRKPRRNPDAEGCMSSKHFGRLAARFKKASGSSGLRFQAAIKDCCFFAEAPSRIEVVVTRPRSGRDDLHRLDDHSTIVDH